MYNNYILGDNMVGYFLAYLLENTTLILHKTLEELDYNLKDFMMIEENIPQLCLKTLKTYILYILVEKHQ